MDKPSSMNTIHIVISPTLLEATSALAENLVCSEVFSRFQESEGKMQTDPEAQKIQAEFLQLQRTIRSQEHTGIAAARDIQRLRELQNLIGHNDVIQASEQARGNAIGLVREVNQEISKLIGIDFATLTRRPGGCC